MNTRRIPALFLAFCVGLPNPVFALRTENAGAEENPGIARGIRAALIGGRRAADAEEVPAVEVLDPSAEALSRLDLKGVFWDFDETLWMGYPWDLEGDFLAELFGIDLAATGARDQMRRYLMEITGAGFDDAIRYANKRYGWFFREEITEAEYFRRFNEKLLRKIDADKLVGPDSLRPGAVELLHAFQKANPAVRQVIATGADAESRDHIGGLLGIRHFFERIHGGGKKAETVRKQLAAWGFEPHQAVLIGDGVPDVQAARKEGILAVGFAPTPEVREAFLKLPLDQRPHIIINGDFRATDEILRILLPRRPAAGAEEVPSFPKPEGVRDTLWDSVKEMDKLWLKGRHGDALGGLQGFRGSFGPLNPEEMFWIDYAEGRIGSDRAIRRGNSRELEQILARFEQLRDSPVLRRPERKLERLVFH